MVNRAKLLLYGFLWFTTAYWAYHWHYLFAWDETLWILGFAAIEMNVVDWRGGMKASGDQDGAR